MRQGNRPHPLPGVCAGPAPPPSHNRFTASQIGEIARVASVPPTARWGSTPNLRIGPLPLWMAVETLRLIEPLIVTAVGWPHRKEPERTGETMKHEPREGFMRIQISRRGKG